MKKFSELSEKLKKDKDDPCWKGYVQVGTKNKNGKEVPNCVPKESNEEKDTHKTKDGRTAKKGLWYNINQKKKRGEAPAKKGDPDYPKTLNIEGKESVDEAMSLADIRRKKEREERRERDGKKRYDPLGDIRRKKEREERRKRDHGDETQHQRMMRKVYGNMMGGLKKEEVEQVDEAVDYFKVAKAFDDYAKKYGGIDKKDFMKVGAFVRQLGRESDVNKQDRTFMAMKKYISAMDTDPRDGVIQIFQKHGMWKNGRIMREGLEEKAVSKAQQKFMGMVRAKQKGEMDDASPEVAKAAKSMSKKDVKDFAKTKHKGLPDKVDEVMSPEARKAHGRMFKARAKKQHDAQQQAEREKRLKAKGWVRNDRGGMSKVKESTELEEAPGKYKRRGDKELYQWGDVNQALMAAGIKPPQILDVLTKLSKKEVGLKESTELTEFSDAQLQQLKKAYADLEKINVTSPTYKKLKAMIARMDKGALEKVARAKIRFVSQIAARELAAKGVKLKAGEYMESVQEGVIDDYNALKAKGKSDSAAIDIMMSMAKYRNMTRDQLSKKVGDARRKGIFKR